MTVFRGIGQMGMTQRRSHMPGDMHSDTLGGITASNYNRVASLR
jgi:hypothetical protein